MSTHSLGHQSSAKEEEWRRPTSNLGKIKSFFLQVSQKTLSKLERKIFQKTSESSVGGSLGEFITVLYYPSASSCSMSLGDLVLLCGIIRRNTDCSFHRLFDPAPSRLRVLEQRAECIPSANRQACLVMRRLQLLCSFQPFCSFLHLSVSASTKMSNI
ncbi:hypothetical protein H5410_027695 [Solanum commersonii]|uniref:Uncharacterized protein n=1 Tax=Solanum commersonii TaxID=4109 RepID=A0A9J5YZW4_SOLCO|nr:hypothetical protein H5410_027695 [Solanum commersonii]